MIANGNKWSVQPDTTLQVADINGMKGEDDENFTEPPKNWNGILISLAIISFVLTMITVAAFLLIPLQTPPYYGRPLTLEDLDDPSLRASPLGSQWLSDYEYAYISEYDGLLLKNTVTNDTTKLISSFTLQQIQAKEFSVSSSRLYVLLTHDIEKERLFKRTAKFSIYDINKHLYYPLKLMKTKLEHPRFQHARWVKQFRNETIFKKIQTPDGSNVYSRSVQDGGSELVIVSENNIYYMPQPKGSPIQITDDGVQNEIFNGVPNLMNEEIMRTSSCLWPSPNGDLLAYITFVDTNVQQIPVIEYGTEGHPRVLNLRYPTVSSLLPEATVWIAEVSSKTQNVSKWKLMSPISLLREEHYIISVGWVDNNKIWVSEISRDQSTSHLLTCEGRDWTCDSVHVNYHEGGISPTVESVVWLENWASFPWPIRTASGWWYNHVVLVGATGRKHPTLKVDECHVKKVLATSASEKLIYFLGSKLSRGTETQQLYAISTEKNTLDCISCSIGCARVKASLNARLTHAIITCIGIPIPTMYLIRFAEINKAVPLNTQPSLRKEIEKIALPISIYEKVSISANVHASVTLTLPPGWVDKDDSLFYPLLIQLVGFENYYDLDVEQQIGLRHLLASDHYIAHARIKFFGSDSSHYDDSIETKAIQMGDVIGKLLENHLYLDNSRISIWGTGSGASLALKLSELAILNLKCAMAVNPVMDWTQYGSYWSERLLGSIHSEGAVRRYEESNILRAFDAVNETQILLMQSTKDPLSHHSFGIAQHLISKGIYFQHIVYPDSTIALRDERLHMIKSFKTFITTHKCVNLL